MANEYLVNSADLTSVANAIREKGETTEQLVFPSDFVTAIEGIKGGGDLAFEVVGGNTEPSSPKENMIWVDTNEEITGWCVDSSEPSDVSDGLVWIMTSEKSSTTIDVLDENSIIIRPTEANQYVSGAWSPVDLYVYMGGAWVSLNGVPSDYQKVEYLQSSKTQYIDTGYIQSVNTEYDGVFAWTNNENYLWSMGVMSEDGQKIFGWQRSDGATYLFIGQELSVINTPVTGPINTNIHVSYIDGVLTVNGTVISTPSPQQISTARSVYLFAYNRSGTPSYGYAKIYSFKLYDNGELMRDFVPCYRKSDSVAGMYDLVTRTFFTNKGTGTFMVGGDIE